MGYSGNDESWEVCRNNSANVKFQDNDFTSQVWDEDSQAYKPGWYDDWEARFPEDTWRDYNKLNEFVSWVLSTWRDACTNENLAESVTYRLNTTTTLSAYPDDASYTVEQEVQNGASTGYYNITFTKDTPAYRLTKFRAEADKYMEIQSAAYYYLFTTFFLMIDSWAKNMFLGFHGSPTSGLQYLDRKVVFEPYDMDTAIGTNNSGVLKFGYYLLDTDHVSSIISGSDEGGSDAPVFNGQDSVLWVNFRDAFRSEYVSMYRDLRANRTWTYQGIEDMFENHQSKWSEAIFNEDAYEKYLYPLMNAVTVDEDTGRLIKTDRYLTMLQGSKQLQRKWWLYNRFRYFDSMFLCGNASSSMITMRLFNSGTLRITPSVDLFVGVSYGGGTTPMTKRTTANTPVDFPYTSAAGVTEMETWIYSADLISDVGDLSQFYPNELDFSRATRLRKLKIGDSDSNYSNANLVTIDVRNCYLLEELDVRNCPNFAITVNLENSPFIEKAYFDGTAITGVDIVDGAPIEVLHVPSTITTLTLLNLSNLTDFTCPSIANVTRLMVTNIDPEVFDAIAALDELADNSQVNIQGIALEMDTAAEIEAFLDDLDRMKGVARERGANGEWIYQTYDSPQVSGTIHIAALTGEQIASYNSRYPYLQILADHVSSNITFKNFDGTVTYKTVACIDGVMQDTAPTGITREQTAQYTFSFVGWNRNVDAETNQESALTDIIADRTVYAAFSKTVRTYTVTWKNSDGTTLETDTNVSYGSTPTYNGTTPKDSYNQSSTGWTPQIATVTGDVIYTATYKPVYAITFKLASEDGGTTLSTVNVVEGATPTYSGATPTSSRGTAEEFEFIGWTPGIVAATAAATYTAVFKDNRSVVIKHLTNQLETFESDSLSKFGAYSFSSRSALISASAPATIVEEYAFESCTNLKSVILSSSSATIIKAYAFYGCTNLERLTIMSSTVATLENTIAFYNTKIASKIGTVYVPDELVSAYQADSMWKNYNIKGIWEDITTNNNYKNDYQIGMTVPMQINGGTYDMQLVAMDADDKADGSGKAEMTWIAKDIIGTHNMNDSNTNANGWPDTAMRSWLRDDVLSTIPSVVQTAIVPVTKTYYNYTTKTTLSTTDTIWIPSSREVFGGTTYDNSGVIYSSIFTDKNSRIKRNNGSADFWWLRSADSYYSVRFQCVNANGVAVSVNATYAYGVVPGFCITPNYAEQKQWDALATSIQNGTYTTDYSIGDEIPYTTSDGETYHAQIVGFDLDVDENDETIPVSFVTKELNTTNYLMNGTNTNSGGWEASVMRTSTMPILEAKLPDYVSGRIVSAKKYSIISDGTEQVTYDKLWIPNYKELGFTSYQESSGSVYSGVFTNDASRIKCKLGESSASYYWTRTANTSNTTYFLNVVDSGSYSSYSANYSIGVAVGFCFDS